MAQIDIPTLHLANGVEIPHIGLGTYPLMGKVLEATIISAFDAGYRLIDTASSYYNEEDLGKSLTHLYDVRETKRAEIFLVSKIGDELYPPGTLGGGLPKGKYFWKNSPYMQGANAVRKVVFKKADDSLKYLCTDYLDLLLMHWPYPDFFEEIWDAMEQLYRDGKVRAIGLSNSSERHIEKLKRNNSIMPMVDQVESSPINTKENLIAYCNENDIRVMIYSPLMNLRRKFMPSYKTCLQDLSHKYGKTIQQIVLRFDVQRGLIPIPKSSHSERLISNIDIFDFAFTEDEMEMLLGCNEGIQTLPESKYCPGL